MTRRESTLPAGACPAGDLLRRFHRGLLPDALTEDVARHVEDCSSCSAAIDAFGDGEDPLIEDLRAPAGGGFASPLTTWVVVGDDGRDLGGGVAPAPEGGRYINIRFHAKGGLGKVSRAFDIELHREIALKQIQERYADVPAARARFEREALITGAMDHPGIVPVYSLGRDAAGRPFYATRFIRGESLHAAIRRHHPPGAAGAAPGARALGVDDLLQRFHDVCDTMAYAHSRGVIHRDLKPSNVMLSPYGATLVVDWGLARATGRPADDGAGPAVPPVGSPEDGSFLTDGVTVLGTPGYMSPEQARGESERVDERADVFGLGAILCEILTGRPTDTGCPAGGRAASDPDGLADALARLEGCGADPELIALTRSCLAPDPVGRPRDASEVAGELSRYRAGVQERLRAAEIARAEATARAEAERLRAEAERSRRRSTLGLAAALLGLVATVGGGVAWWEKQRHDRLARIDSYLQAAATDLDAADRMDGASAAAKAKAKEDDARVALARVDELAGGALDAARTDRLSTLGLRFDRQVKLRALVSALEAVRVVRIEYFDDYRRADREYGAAFRAFGLHPETLDPPAFGSSLAGRPASVEIAAALDDWTTVRMHLAGGKDDRSWRRLTMTAGAVDPDPWRNDLRALRGRPIAEQREKLRRLSADEQVLGRQSAVSLSLLSDMLRSAGERDLSAKVLRLALGRNSGDFWINMMLGVLSMPPLGAHHRPDEAVRFFREAIRLKPGLAEAHAALGGALLSLGKAAEAVAADREAIRLKPGLAEAHAALGGALLSLGKAAEAVDAYREAIRLKPGLAEAHFNLGGALLSLGKAAEAVAADREAIRLNPDLAEAHAALGGALLSLGKAAEAVAADREAIRLKPGLAEADAARGGALLSLGKAAEAVAFYREAIRLKPGLSMAHFNLGSALRAQGKAAEAVDAYREAIRLMPGSPVAQVARDLIREVEEKGRPNASAPGRDPG